MLRNQQESQGAQYGSRNQPPLHYGNREAEIRIAQDSVVLIDLSHLSVFELNCPEARRWGNGMFTNNIKRLPEGHGNRNAMCDDRGRVLGLLDLYCISAEKYVIVLDGVERDWFESHYRMYMILDDVELDPDAEDAAGVLSLQGPRAEGLLLELGWSLPTEERAHVLREDGIRICRRSRNGLAGFDLIIPPDLLETTWTELYSAGAQPAGSEAMEVLRIRKGEARWPQDGREKTLIHELGLESEVCSFSKGCYVGQEVINRVDVKGAINKRITRMRLKGSEAPPLGSPVFCEDKEIGRITSAVQYGEDVLGLGILRKTAWESGTEIRVEADGQTWNGETIARPHG